jgi:hypothetical protein
MLASLISMTKCQSINRASAAQMVLLAAVLYEGKPHALQSWRCSVSCEDARPSLRSGFATTSPSCLLLSCGAVLPCCWVPADTPNAETGWSPERAKAFGASHVTAFVNTVPTLLKERGTKDEQH